jgi:hypothetical protein
MPKSREIRNAITPQGAIRAEVVHYKSGLKKLFVFNCLVCSKEIKVQEKHIKYSRGKCKKHAQMLRPFEAVYGSLRRNAKERGILLLLTYEDYLEFTKEKNCFYCNREIPWQPWNEHGKNNPGYYLDRKNSMGPYSKSNCVVCCTVCNLTKRSLSAEQFIELAKLITTNHYSGSCGA